MGLPESMQTLVSCLLVIISTFMYFRAAAKSREGLVDDPGTKAEKEEAAASIYDFVSGSSTSAKFRDFACFPKVLTERYYYYKVDKTPFSTSSFDH